MVRSLGADHVIDYINEDFAKNGQTYDIIFDTVGKTSFSHSKRSLTKNGTYVSAFLSPPLILQVLWTSVVGRKKAKSGTSPDLKEDLVFLRELIQAGVVVSVIDRSWALEQMADAHDSVEQGHKKGKRSHHRSPHRQRIVTHPSQHGDGQRLGVGCRPRKRIAVADSMSKERGPAVQRGLFLVAFFCGRAYSRPNNCLNTPRPASSRAPAVPRAF
jgi:hypothetical protein